MKIALSWLAKYIEIKENTKELEEILTFSGIEVEAVENIPALPETVFSAKIISAEPVPETDHLKRCLVDIGNFPYPEKTEDGYLQVICGAPNCRTGMMAIIALPGSVLPEMTIAKAQIKGIDSYGMLCSEKELGISDNHSGIIELSTETPIGITANELYELPDTIFELEITPNRPDLLGYIGIARDLSAKLNRSLKMPEIKIPEAKCKAETMPLELVNKVPELCPRYIARLFNNVELKESPLWLKSALIKSGLRPINNLVDITNYVMLEYGHPLHCFDYDKLAALPEKPGIPAIVIRRAYQNEPIITLDGKSYLLEGQEMVIADGIKPSAIAGVMGGNISAISETTKRIVLESAAFNPSSIRRTSYKHKISTDSSYRFERHLSECSAEDASIRATQLICELANAELCEVVYDSYPIPVQPLIIGIRPSRYTQVIGYELEEEKIKDYLTRLGLKFIQYGNWKPGKINSLAELYCHHTEEMKQGKTEFTELPNCEHTHYYEIPPYRVDLEREIDIIEEIARLDGYDKIPVKTLPQRIMDRHSYRIKKNAVDYLISRGFYETLNYSFSEPDLLYKLGYEDGDSELEMITLKNPQSSNQSGMRTSLIPQLLQNLAYNLNRGEKNIKLFELGKTYHRQEALSYEPYFLAGIVTGLNKEEHWQDKASPITLFWVKGIVEELLSLLHLENWSVQETKVPFLSRTESVSYYLVNKELAYYGKLNSVVAEKFDIDTIELKQDIWIVQFAMENIINATRNLKTHFQEIPRFPFVTRDISFLIAEEIPYSEIIKTIAEIERNIISEVTAFDEYRGKQIPEGKRSLTLRLKFRDKEKTLTDERVDYLIDLIIKKLRETWQIKMR
jgi:phenylalanyl-tRNA synthetase beta chain